MRQHRHAYLKRLTVAATMLLGMVHSGFAEPAVKTSTHKASAASHHYSGKSSKRSPHHTVLHHHRHPGYYNPEYYKQHGTVSTLPTHADAVAASEAAEVTGNTGAENPASTETAKLPISRRLVNFVHNAIASLRYTSYKFGGKLFDTVHGIYEVDCSSYVDHILQKVCPRSYSTLVSSSGVVTPNSKNYYEFFTRLSANIKRSWDKIENAKQLQPGDVLVFRFRGIAGSSGSGHVMVVMNKPVFDNNVLLVRVTDSAPSGHTNDTRPRHNSGIGIGTLLLKVNPYTGEPSAYAWGLGSPWKSSVSIAMGRPIDMGMG